MRVPCSSVPPTEMIDAAADDASRVSHFEQLGRLMAQMHDQASSWQPSAAQRRTPVEAWAWSRARLSEYGKHRDTYSKIHPRAQCRHGKAEYGTPYW